MVSAQHSRTGKPLFTLVVSAIPDAHKNTATHTSVAAETAASTLSKVTTAHLVGKSGANRTVASVTIPKVPSAPMNSFVVSHPADDFRAR